MYQVERLGDDGAHVEFRKGLVDSVGTVQYFCKSFKTKVRTCKEQGRVVGGWESIRNTTAESVVGKKVVQCGAPSKFK